MSEAGYPVVWRDKEYRLGDITIGVKKGFVKWAKAYLTREGMENLAGHAEVLSSYLANMYGEVWWSDVGMSKPCHAVLNSPDGGRQLNRLLFGASVKHLSDADLDAMLDEKEADPTSDYMVAMKLIRENADPKVHSGPALEGGTDSSATT